ncbi:Uncharacterised protein [Yersinia rohdei]|uniref:hypothetical protein n=1 Tax=Yersinia rohdei TaxID=29485 RepID=UPI00061B9045|nr:hypothetical protein [Yersinia rohdei]CND93224.1 Uncharacterised protein [Yersinia rohdei]
MVIILVLDGGGIYHLLTIYLPVFHSKKTLIYIFEPRLNPTVIVGLTTIVGSIALARGSAIIAL